MNKTFYDIALLILEKPVEFNERIQPACLPKTKSSNYPATYTISYAVGWVLNSFFFYNNLNISEI